MQRILSFTGPLLAMLVLAGAAAAQEAPPPAAPPAEMPAPSVAPPEPAAPPAPADAAPAAPFLPVPAASTPASGSATVISTIGRADMMAIMQQAGMATVSDGTRDETSPWVV